MTNACCSSFACHLATLPDIGAGQQQKAERRRNACCNRWGSRFVIYILYSLLHALSILVLVHCSLVSVDTHASALQSGAHVATNIAVCSLACALQSGKACLCCCRTPSSQSRMVYLSPVPKDRSSASLHTPSPSSRAPISIFGLAQTPGMPSMLSRFPGTPVSDAMTAASWLHDMSLRHPQQVMRLPIKSSTITLSLSSCLCIGLVLHFSFSDIAACVLQFEERRPVLN